MYIKQLRVLSSRRISRVPNPETLQVYDSLTCCMEHFGWPEAGCRDCIQRLQYPHFSKRFSHCGFGVGAIRQIADGHRGV